MKWSYCDGLRRVRAASCGVPGAAMLPSPDDPRDPTALACVREEPKTLRNSAELDLRTVADKERAARIIISVAQAQADIDATRLREKAVRRVKGWLTWQQPPQIDQGAASGSPSTVRHLPA